MDTSLDDLPHTKVRDTYRALRAAIDALTLALLQQDPSYAHWVAQAPEDLLEHRSPRDSIIWVYGHMFFQRSATTDARRTKHRPGFLATHPHTLKLAIAVNQAKLAFKAAMLDIKDKHHRKQMPEALFKDFAKRNPSQAETLRTAGISCVHLVEAYRLIPVLTETPRRIGFSWQTKGKVITPITWHKAADFIEYSGGGPELLERLETYPDDTLFAMARPSQPHLRANITLAHGPLTPVPASLPILYPATPGQAPPLFVPVPYDPDQVVSVRLDRSDKIIDYANPIMQEAPANDATGEVTGIYPYRENATINLNRRKKRGAKTTIIGA